MNIPKVLCHEETGGVVVKWAKDQKTYTMTFSDEDTPPNQNEGFVWLPVEVWLNRRWMEHGPYEGA